MSLYGSICIFMCVCIDVCMCVNIRICGGRACVNLCVCVLCLYINAFVYDLCMCKCFVLCLCEHMRASARVGGGHCVCGGDVYKYTG